MVSRWRYHAAVQSSVGSKGMSYPSLQTLIGTRQCEFGVMGKGEWRHSDVKLFFMFSFKTPC